MRKVLLLAVSVASLGLALPAQAADVVPEVPEETFSWTGFHVGAGGGAGYNTYDVQSDALFLKDFIIGVDSRAMAIDGDDLGKWYGFGTVEVGLDYQFPDSPIVVGILANYDFNGDSSAQAEAFTFENEGDFSNSSIEAELDDSWFVGGRLGFAFNERTLVYGLGGYTWVDGKVKGSHALDDVFFPSSEISFDEKESVDGWTVGGGIEHAFTDLISLKLEYRHDFLDDIEWDNFEETGPFTAAETSGKAEFSRDTVRAVLSLRFNPL